MHRTLIFFCFLFVGLTCHCTDLKSQNAEITVVGGDSRIGTYISSWPGFRTSSYWIEGPSGLILIDTQFLLSAAEEFVNWAEQRTGKKAVMAIVLHPNPDKFNGTSIYQKRGIKVVTSEQIAKLVPSVHKLRSGWFFERFKPDYPSELPTPESFGNKTTELKAAGLTVKAHVMGKGCSDAHVVVEFDENVFVGDLITIGFHSWLELGHLKEWLLRLQEIRDLDPKFVRTGRGGSGDKDAITREEEYLKTVLSLLNNYRKKYKKGPTDEIKKKFVTEIVARYPAYDYPMFIENGITAMW